MSQAQQGAHTRLAQKYIIVTDYDIAELEDEFDFFQREQGGALLNEPNEEGKNVADSEAKITEGVRAPSKLLLLPPALVGLCFVGLVLHICCSRVLHGQGANSYKAPVIVSNSTENQRLDSSSKELAKDTKIEAPKAKSSPHFDGDSTRGPSEEEHSTPEIIENVPERIEPEVVIGTLGPSSKFEQEALKKFRAAIRQDTSAFSSASATVRGNPEYARIAAEQNAAMLQYCVAPARGDIGVWLAAFKSKENAFNFRRNPEIMRQITGDAAKDSHVLVAAAAANPDTFKCAPHEAQANIDFAKAAVKEKASMLEHCRGPARGDIGVWLAALKSKENAFYFRHNPEIMRQITGDAAKDFGVLSAIKALNPKYVAYINAKSLPTGNFSMAHGRRSY